MPSSFKPPVHTHCQHCGKPAAPTAEKYHPEDAIHIYIILYLCIFVRLGVGHDGVMALNQKQRVKIRLHDLENDSRANDKPVDNFELEDQYDHLGNLVSVVGRNNSHVVHARQRSERFSQRGQS